MIAFGFSIPGSVYLIPHFLRNLAIVADRIDQSSRLGSCESPIGTNSRPGRDKASPHDDLVLLCRVHCGDSHRRCLASVSLGGRSEWAGTGRVRDPRDEPGVVVR